MDGAARWARANNSKPDNLLDPKAMPVILTTPAEIETWMTAPTEDALKLQRELPDGTLKIVARGERKDEAAQG